MTNQHTLHLTADLYQALVRQAERLGTTPDGLLERLLARDLTALLDHLDVAEAAPTPPDSDTAMAAVRRLTRLFADLALPDLDVALDDPMLALTNADLGDPRP